MTHSTHPIGKLIAKISTGLLVLVCLALGLVGLVLPIIPGLLFLAIAAVIGARHSPSLERSLRRNRATSRYLDHAERFSDLELAGKLQLGALLCAKAVLDGIAVVVSTIRGWGTAKH